MLLFAPKASLDLAARVADALGVSLSPSEEREFDGGEHKMRPLVEVRNEDAYVVQSLCGDANSSANDKLCRLLFFAGALKDAGAERVTAVTPYLAYARKDRRTQPQDPVTTRYVAAAHAAFVPTAMQLFESRAADNVLVTDSIELRPEFTKWLANGLRVCSIAPLVARTLQELAGRRLDMG